VCGVPRLGRQRQTEVHRRTENISWLRYDPRRSGLYAALLLTRGVVTQSWPTRSSGRRGCWFEACFASVALRSAAGRWLEPSWRCRRGDRERQRLGETGKALPAQGRGGSAVAAARAVTRERHARKSSVYPGTVWTGLPARARPGQATSGPSDSLSTKAGRS
jgi:hypothetical protein